MEIKNRLSQQPSWCRGVFRFHLPGKNGPVPVLANKYHDYKKEKDKSSFVCLWPYFVAPTPASKINTFQIFLKNKEKRKDIRLIWEFLMLDIWSHVLRNYAQTGEITLSAPQAFQLERQTLKMAFQLGTIGKHLSNDYRHKHRIIVVGRALKLYEAFALHLGALAAVKEAEELYHGDYQLRHVLFDPGDQLYKFSSLIQGWNMPWHPQFLKDPAQLSPSLSVVDLENAQRTPVSATYRPGFRFGFVVMSDLRYPQPSTIRNRNPNRN